MPCRAFCFALSMQTPYFRNMRNPHYFEAILGYAEKMTSPASDILSRLERETHLKMLSPQMICGFHLGRFLSLVSKIKRPKCIVEFGTFTGYATFCMMEGLTKDGVIHTFEVNPETCWLFNKYKKELDPDGRIIQHLEDGLHGFPKLNLEPDLVWIDAGKKSNLELFNIVLPNMKAGGIIMVDNTLWSGKVLSEDNDEHTRAIHEFNQRVVGSPLLQTFFLPVRDGVTLSIVK